MSDGITDAWRASDRYFEEERNKKRAIDFLKENDKEFKDISDDIDLLNKQIRDLKFLLDRKNLFIENAIKQYLKNEKL